MQVNKPNKGNNPYKKSSSPAPKQEHVASEASKSEADKDSFPIADDSLIDLYEDQNSNKPENDEVVINIDFTKPAELFSSLYQRLKKWLHVAKRSFNKEFVKSMKFNSKKERTRSFKILGGALVAAAAMILVVSAFFGGNNKTLTEVAQVQGVKGESVITEDAPEFELVYPEGKSREDFDSIAVVSPPGSPLAYAYLDKIDEISVQVSQQEVPDNLKNDQDQQLKSLAENFLANTPINGNDYIAYVGLNRPGGPQSIVLIKSDRLIFMKTDSEIEHELLGIYMDNLAR